MSQGITADGVSLLQDAVNKGVLVNSVNTMNFDMGSWGWNGLSPTTQMGQICIATCNSVKAQLQALGLTKSRVGAIMMVGLCDVHPECYGLNDAQDCA